MALSFRDSAALEVAIRSGLVSREAAAGGAKVARGADDAFDATGNYSVRVPALFRG